VPARTTRRRRRIAPSHAIILACGVAGLGSPWLESEGVAAAASDCAVEVPATFTVTFPKVVNPPNPHGWDLPVVWGPLNGQVPASDSIEVPNGRPIYALIVSGYSTNAHLDQLLVYDFARHLMAQGAYVHYSWWNNLLAPYMERPLHHSQSDPATGDSVVATFATPAAAEAKATPGENYQFLADAKHFLAAIRANNPEAVIVVVGHSMGGHSVAQLANETDVLIDLLAPIDPVASRTYPWALPSQQSQSHFNWTRYRATRESFNGYRSMTWSGGVFGECIPTGPWRKAWGEAVAGSTHALCLGEVHVHGAPHMTLGSNVVNLYHRWQHEAPFPFDYDDVRLFNPGYPFPPGGSQNQLLVATQSSGSEPLGWPLNGTASQGCCPSVAGVGWPADGHGEIIGARGPAPAVHHLASRVKTSPECGSSCTGLTWPARTLSDSGTWSNGNATQRVVLLQQLEALPLGQVWTHRPYNSSLCRVSSALIDRFETMNKPPSADAGGDQVIVCDGCSSATVTLDGSWSLDPDGMPLTYSWSWAHGSSAAGPIVQVTMPVGAHCVTLEVKDSVGHVKRDRAFITVIDGSSPVVPFTSAAGAWRKAAGSVTEGTFDEFFPGVPNGTGCLLAAPTVPATLEFSEGSVVVSAQDGGTPYCAVTNSATAPAVSDARIASATAVVTYAFDPPITALYTYFGSLASGHVASMTLFDELDAPLATIVTPPSTHSALAAGQGFVSTVPVHRVEFGTTEPGSVLVGAFVGLRPGEPSLGTVDLGPDYGGPGGGPVQIDFAVAFTGGCAADLNGDGIVDGGDLGMLLSEFGPCDDDCVADLNGDGIVDGADLGQLLANWGSCP